MPACIETVTVGYSNHRQAPITVVCGTYFGGEKKLCDNHESEAAKRYPQGWRGYPGDTCKHGVYVGGCGADHMCGRCEMGED